MKSKPTAVICDDDATSRALAAAVLAKAGFEVIAAVDKATDAIQVAVVSKPDVVVLDLSLPYMSGEDAIPAIREVAPNCRIVIWSSFDSTTALRKGGTAVVPKGAFDQLLSVLKALAKRPLPKAS